MSNLSEKFEDHLKEIIRLSLQLRDEENPEDARKVSNPRWDSLVQLNILLAIESQFSIKVDPQHYSRFTSYKSIYLLLEEMLG